MRCPFCVHDDTQVKDSRPAEDHVAIRRRRFCPACGSTICFTVTINPGLIAIPAGLFADPATPPPLRSVFEERRHPWVNVPEGAVRLPRGRDG
jgi:hypothetical protein